MGNITLKRSFSSRTALYLLPLAFLGVFFFYPLAAVVAESFAPGGRLDLTPIASLWREPYFARSL